MALQHDEKKDADNVQIEAGRFMVESTVKQQKLYLSLRDKITKKLFRASFAPYDLQSCGFNESQAKKLESIGQFIQSAQAGEQGLRLQIKIPQDNGGQPGGPQGVLSTAKSFAEVVIVKEDNYFGNVNYKLKLDEVARDKTDINRDSIDDIKEDVNYMREQIATLTADLSIAKQHQLPKGSIIRWHGSRHNVPKFWQIFKEGDDNKADDEEEEDGNKLKKEIFTYKSDFDENGIIYALGSGFSTKEWRNPSTTGIVEVRTASRMGRVSKPKDFLIGRVGGIDCYINAVEDNWFLINFKNLTIRPTNYTLRHDVAPTNENHLRNWQLQGSNDGDGDNWDVLINHIDDTSLNEPDGTSTWTIANINTFYQYFRLKMTKPGSSMRWSICCSGFEIYGELRQKDDDNGAPKKIYTLIKMV